MDADLWDMQGNIGILLPILGITSFLALGLSFSSNQYVFGSQQLEQPKITEIEIPGVLNLTVADDNATGGNILNASYTQKGIERYFLLNLTTVSLEEAETADCQDKTSPEGERIFVCIPRDPNDVSSSALLCNTNTNECIQPSGRHFK
jgi:hypothetical protein